MTSWRDARSSALSLAIAALLGAAVPARADDGIASAEALVRTVWFEGLPYEKARELTPAGVQRLAQMLGDPAEAGSHVNIVVALGMSESPLAYPALERLWLREPRGEISREEWRARSALPFALGYLARADRRALRLLERELDRSHPPTWSYKHLRGERLGKQVERNVLSALGSTGLAEAEDVLARAARRAEAAGDERLASDVSEARARRLRVAREGPARALRGER
jgi:hypothetical protein